MFSQFFIGHPRFAIVLSLVLVLLGGISLNKLPVAEYPEVTPPQLYVSASYTGASADVVMQTVAIPLEDSINGVDDLLYFSSTCGNDGDYTCTVTFKSGTDSDIAMVNLQNAVKRAEAKLPSEVTKTGVTVEKRGSDILAMFVFLSDGTSMDIMELGNYVDANIKNAVTRLDGVASADIMSQKEYSMRIWLDPLRMAGLNISTSDITNAIENQNIQAAAGNIGTENSNRFVNYKLNVEGRLKTAKEFEDIVIRRDDDGSVVRLKDISRVEIGAKSGSGRSLFNGKEAISMAIYRTPESNALDTVKRVKAELDTWKSRFPAGVSYEVGYDPTEFITASTIVCMTPPAIMGLGVVGGANFELCSIGETDTTQLSETSKKVAMALTQDPAIQYATSAFNADTPQVYLAIDRRKAESLGLSANAIFSALQSNFASVYVNDFTMKGQNYEVKIQASPKDRCSLNNISTLQIRSSKDEMIPLSSVATLRYAVGPNQIMRFNKMVCAEMNAAAATGVSSAALIRRIEAFQLPENYQVQWVGQSYQEKQNEGRIVFLMAFAIIFAYLFLVAQYESWSIPISVMLTVGTAILGALLGLWVCGTHVGKWLGVADTASLSIYAQLGMVMLIGLTAKNAILMVEFSKQERENGKSIFDAAVNGANLRYRAVLMTALSFLFGVFPLVIATGAGAGSRRAIGITTFSGMLLATVVGIVFTPALYAVFQRMREWVKNTLHRRQTELRKC